MIDEMVVILSFSRKNLSFKLNCLSEMRNNWLIRERNKEEGVGDKTKVRVQACEIIIGHKSWGKGGRRGAAERNAFVVSRGRDNSYK